MEKRAQKGHKQTYLQQQLVRLAKYNSCNEVVDKESLRYLVDAEVQLEDQHSEHQDQVLRVGFRVRVTETWAKRKVVRKKNCM